MLNPSTADSTQDDRTIRRCISFSLREGCAGLAVWNLFAFRATDPAAMKAADDPVGPANDTYLRQGLALASGPIIAGWGVHGSFMNRGQVVLDMFGDRLKCLGRTKDGHPRHPLYLRSDAPLRPLAERSAENCGTPR
ncbi:DUF1643 domain-containing protein [Roseibium sp. Sym1]|uniref:DUF1643 domain-containing protein n=1 Tax=Roseibium sp. Sym1 TaxID=3016006 RepID=UPI0022B3E2C9|nr:DUF1643 domain-containing protein [Roseibium sp. Sym1]